MRIQPTINSFHGQWGISHGARTVAILQSLPDLLNETPPHLAEGPES